MRWRVCLPLTLIKVVKFVQVVGQKSRLLKYKKKYFLFEY